MKKYNKHDIEEVLEIGDVVWLVTGEETKVTRVGREGFETEGGFFSYEQHGISFFLTRYGYEKHIKGDENK